MLPRLRALLKTFLGDDYGAGTPFAIGWLILCFMIAGISIDVSNGWRVKQFLQSTADTAALSAAMELRLHGPSDINSEVKSVANYYAANNMYEGRFGDVLLDDDIVLGTWSGGTFTPTDPVAPSKPNAVMAMTRQEGGASTVIGTFFLRFAGFDYFTANAVAVAETFVQTCYQDGMISMGAVSMRAQQNILGEYCIHGDKGLAMGGSNFGTTGNPNSGGFELSVAGNYFASGTTASTAGGWELCGQSTSGELCDDEHNPGIEEAYQPDASLTVPTPSEISTMITDIGNIASGLYSPEHGYDDNYIRVFETSVYDDDADLTTVLPVGGYKGTKYIQSGNFKAKDLEPGYIYNVFCSRGDKQINFGMSSDDVLSLGYAAGSVPSLSGFVVVSSNCNFEFDSSVNYRNVVFANAGSGTGTYTFGGNSYVNFGNVEPTFDCSKDPVIIATLGNVNFAAGLETANTHFIVGGGMTLASSGNSEEMMQNQGSNFWVNGDVKLGARHVFSSCPTRATNPFDIYYTARLVY